MVLQYNNGVSSNPIEGRTKICQLKDLILTRFRLIFRHIYISLHSIKTDIKVIKMKNKSKNTVTKLSPLTEVRKARVIVSPYRGLCWWNNPSVLILYQCLSSSNILVRKARVNVSLQRFVLVRMSECLLTEVCVG
jgi:hypothetical protein